MNQKELKEIIELISKKQIAEFEIERGDFKLRIKTVNSSSIVSPVALSENSTVTNEIQSYQSSSASKVESRVLSESAVPKETNELHIIKAPIVGTFYRAPSPTAESFVEIGKHVNLGAVLCIIEAMKLMNEIESDVSGKIMEIYQENGSPVEYGQPLFGILLD